MDIYVLDVAMHSTKQVRKKEESLLFLFNNPLSSQLHFMAQTLLDIVSQGNAGQNKVQVASLYILYSQPRTRVVNETILRPKSRLPREVTIPGI